MKKLELIYDPLELNTIIDLKEKLASLTKLQINNLYLCFLTQSTQPVFLKNETILKQVYKQNKTKQLLCMEIIPIHPDQDPGL